MSSAILSRLPLWPLILLSLGLVGLDFGQPLLAEQAQLRFNVILLPVYSALIAPWQAAWRGWQDARGMWRAQADNVVLRQDVARLRDWQKQAERLAAENQALKAQLHYVPGPSIPFVTTTVLADTSGLYSRSVLVTGKVRNGDAVFDAAGLAGRVIRSGGGVATVMLLTDAGSRVPVLLGPDRTHALMEGDNGAMPKLLYWPDGEPPHEGEIIVTSPEGRVFPQGLLVGTVHMESGRPLVRLAAQLAHLDIVRVVHEAGGLP